MKDTSHWTMDEYIIITGFVCEAKVLSVMVAAQVIANEAGDDYFWFTDQKLADETNMAIYHLAVKGFVVDVREDERFGELERAYNVDFDKIQKAIDSIN